jgi:hypothetical protein
MAGATAFTGVGNGFLYIVRLGKPAWRLSGIQETTRKRRRTWPYFILEEWRK